MAQPPVDDEPMAAQVQQPDADAQGEAEQADTAE